MASRWCLLFVVCLMVGQVPLTAVVMSDNAIVRSCMVFNLGSVEYWTSVANLILVKAYDTVHSPTIHAYFIKYLKTCIHWSNTDAVLCSIPVFTDSMTLTCTCLMQLYLHRQIIKCFIMRLYSFVCALRSTDAYTMNCKSSCHKL